MPKWIDIGVDDELAGSAKHCLHVEGFSVVLLRVNGDWRAIANVCPHAGLPLGEGEVHGGTIVCPFHGYTYDTATGRNIDDPHDVPVMTYPVRQTSSGRVEVSLPVPDEAAAQTMGE